MAHPLDEGKLSPEEYYAPPEGHAATKGLLSQEQEEVDRKIKAALEGVDRCEELLARAKRIIERMEIGASDRRDEEVSDST